MTPSEWARRNRKYPPSSGRPGKRDPSYTPYIVPFCDAADDYLHQVVCLITSSQSGKTDAVLDLIGWRLDTRPRPQLYVGPSKDFLSDQFEPRLMALLDEAPKLRAKLARGKRLKKTRKMVAGVPVRLAWAGSATQLSSDQAGDVHVDELDRMGRDIAHEGDPLTLVKARAFTFRDRKYYVTSTPKRGSIDVERDESSGLEFWKMAEALESPIWKLYQSGTRHHWSWPCPHCHEYFIPRFRQLKWPEKATAEEATRQAYVVCPRCGGVIEEKHKEDMNARGVYVAPGQSVGTDGVVNGEMPKSLTLSLWVSGLASPFVSFGERAAAFIEAIASGDQEKIQGVVNTGFGELFAPGGGEAPEWHEVAAKRSESGYALREAPAGIVHFVLSVDVQKNRLVYVIRGWGVRATSWLYDAGQIWGPTQDEAVWNDLALLLTTPIELEPNVSVPIKLCFIDSGFRPGKPFEIPLNHVYEFCRRFQRQVRPTKGASHAMQVPLKANRIEVKSSGKVAPYGIELVQLDSDHWKSWVHERVRWPSTAPGAWHLPHDIDDDYCQQIVSEARVRKPSGKAIWVARSRDNHYLDCEALQAAASYMLGMQRFNDDMARRISDERSPAGVAQRTRPTPPADAPTPSDWLDVPNDWL